MAPLVPRFEQFSFFVEEFWGGWGFVWFFGGFLMLFGFLVFFWCLEVAKPGEICLFFCVFFVGQPLRFRSLWS